MFQTKLMMQLDSFELSVKDSSWDWYKSFLRKILQCSRCQRRECVYQNDSKVRKMGTNQNIGLQHNLMHRMPQKSIYSVVLIVRPSHPEYFPKPLDFLEYKIATALAF